MSTALALPTLGASRKLASTPAAGGASAQAPRKRLPAWPLLTLFYGFPAFWALGLLQIVPLVLSVTMVIYLTIRGGVRVPRSLWIWAAFIFWVIVCTVSLEDVTDYIAWTLRFVNILNAGVYALYYFNAKESISINQLLGSNCPVGYGCRTRMGRRALPRSARSNTNELRRATEFHVELFGERLYAPTLRGGSKPLGAPEPYVRPAAPFPYANSWGLAFTVLTPVMFAFFARTRSWLLRIFLAIVLGASVVPLVATSNRGMFIGLGFATAYVIIRLIIGRYWGLVTAAGVMVVGVVTALIASGTVAAILGRQQYSDSTGGRAALYRSTWAASLESPIVGYGTPRMELSVGVSMGTQGYLWTLMFCFGFVGLAIYALFILSILGEGLKVRTPAGFWLHSIPVCSCVVIIFYSFDVAQLSVLLLSAMACIRARYYREEL